MQYRWDVTWGPLVNLNPNWWQRRMIWLRVRMDRMADAYAVMRGDKIAVAEDEVYF